MNPPGAQAEPRRVALPQLVTPALAGWIVHVCLGAFLLNSLIVGDWTSVGMQALALAVIGPLWLLRRRLGDGNVMHMVCGVLVVYQLSLLYLSRPVANIGVVWFLLLPVFAGAIGNHKRVFLWLPVSLVAVFFAWTWVAQHPSMAHPASLANLVAINIVVSVIGFGVLLDRQRREAAFERALELAEREAVERAAAEVKALRAERETSEFLATLSHELRTPLTSILLSVDQLRAGAGQLGEADAVEDIAQSARALSTLLTEVLDLAKVHAGRVPVLSEPFAVAEILEVVSRLVAPQVHAAGLRLVCVVPPELQARWIGDPVRVRQVLLNLVTNAIKHTAQGDIVVSVASTDGGLRFAVRDSGVGLSDAQMGRIFLPYVQVSEGAGAGLGLAIAREFVQAMGGEMSVASELGQGSTFAFHIAVVPESPAPVSDRVKGPAVTVSVEESDAAIRAWIEAWILAWGGRPSAHEEGPMVRLTGVVGGPGGLATLLESPSSRPERGAGGALAPDGPGGSVGPILICDDDNVVRRALLRTLRHLGHEVIAVSTAREAIDAVANASPSCAFLDVEIGHETGIDVVRSIRAGQGAERAMPICMISGSGRYREAALEAGADHFLLKPVGSAELAEMLQLLLS